MSSRTILQLFAKAAKVSRRLLPIDSENSHTPFKYDINAMSKLRPDQVPRFLGALTHPERLPTRKLKLSDLTAIQNRVNTEKVDAIREADVLEHPVVARFGDKDYIIDGHHRAAADWLNGDVSITAHYKDLSEIDNSVKSLVRRFRL